MRNEMPQPSKVSTTAGWLFKLIWIVILGVGLLFTITFYKGYGLSAAALALAITLVLLATTPLLWKAADYLRRFMAPTAFYSGSATTAFKQKIFWLVGPQWITVTLTFFGVWGLGFTYIEQNFTARTGQLSPAVSASTTTHQEASQPEAPKASEVDATANQAHSASSANVAVATDLPQTTPDQHVTESLDIWAPSEAKTLLLAMLKNPTNQVDIYSLAAQLEQLFKSNCATTSVPAREKNNTALLHFREGRIAESITWFEEAVAMNPCESEFRNNLGYALRKNGDHDKAEYQFGVTLSYAPKRSSAWLNLADLYSATNRPRNAVPALILAYQFHHDRERFLQHLQSLKNGQPPGLETAASEALVRLTAR